MRADPEDGQWPCRDALDAVAGSEGPNKPWCGALSEPPWDERLPIANDDDAFAFSILELTQNLLVLRRHPALQRGVSRFDRQHEIAKVPRMLRTHGLRTSGHRGITSARVIGEP